MKKIISIFLLISLLILSACGNQPDETAPAATTPIATTPPTLSNGYVSPSVSAMSDLERAEIEEKARSYFTWFCWFDETKIETRHTGWRYYGRVNGAILLGRPFCTAKGTDEYRPFSDAELYYYKDGKLTYVVKSELDSDTYALIDAYYASYENRILDRTDLDDPCWYGGQNLPVLEDSVYYDADAAKDRYLGTYNEYSIYYGDSGIRGSHLEIIGGVAFWTGEYHTFYAVKDGKSYQLAFVADRGYLTYEHLRAIAYYMYGEQLPEDPPYYLD